MRVRYLQCEIRSRKIFAVRIILCRSLCLVILNDPKPGTAT